MLFQQTSLRRVHQNPESGQNHRLFGLDTSDSIGQVQQWCYQGDGEDAVEGPQVKGRSWVFPPQGFGGTLKNLLQSNNSVAHTDPG